MDSREALISEIEQEARSTARWTGREAFSPRVLDALRKVRREAFVPSRLRRGAYINAPLRIGHGQTISQPFIVVLMTDLLDLKPGDNVLEVGTGSGYQAAILAELTGRVCSIEVIPELARNAASALAAEGYGRRDDGSEAVALRTGDGAAGWPERAPFDAIIVTAAAPDIPAALLEQLGPGGRMVVPVGSPWGEQMLRVITKEAGGAVTSRDILPVAFVPLTGERPA
jgi:protein-L-isoaspartate(D-aspartate) O-methyltransferase